MTIKEQRMRNQYIKMMYDNICGHLNKDTRNEFSEKISNLIAQNCSLLGAVTPTFFREGQLFVAGTINRRAKTIDSTPYSKLNLQLHPRLYQEFAAIQKDHQERQGYTRKAVNYVGIVLSRVPTLEDVLDLIPAAYTRDLSSGLADIFDNGPPMTTTERLEFKADHREGEEAFMKLQLLEMIRG